jgi:DNA gyrase subunit A
VTDDLGRVRVVRIEDEMRTSYLDYAMSVIVARALPDVRDGLKPVHRRILYSMGEMGLSGTSSYRKCAAIVGEVMGKYHPHGDAAIYDTLVRLAQDFSMRYPLVDGQGNFGSIDGDSAAAMRYTEARLTHISAEMLADIDKNTVDFVDTYDGTNREPSVLPAKLPNLLVNGSSGIAVGMATNIPPHHLGEVCDAASALIDNPELTSDDLCKYILGPDFPTGGTMYRYETRRNSITGENETVDAIREMYAHGRGRVVVRAQVAFEETRNGRMAIIVTELPYMVNKATLLERMAELVGAKKLEGIADLRDESDRDGMRIYIEIKRDADPHRVLNNLFKHTAMQTAFNMNMLALVDGQPQTLPLKAVLAHYIEHRREVIRRRTEFDLEKARARAHILEGLKIALDNLDEVIKTIRESADVEKARNNLMGRFGLTEIQAQAILDMRLARLAALERKKIEDEYLEVIQLIAELEDILANPSRILAVIKDELAALKTKYAGARRTRIADDSSREMTDEDLIADEDVVVTISRRGYIKRQPVATYRRQARGRQGHHRPRDPRGRRRRAPARRQHPRLGALLHQPRPGLLGQGPYHRRRQPPGQGHRDHQSPRRPGGTGRGADGHDHPVRLQCRQVPGHGHSQRHRQEEPARAVREGPLQRHHRHNDRRRRRARLGGRGHRRPTTSSSPAPRARSPASTKKRSGRWAARPPESSASASPARRTTSSA